MPGRSLPSRYSRLAPPPVEMWPKARLVEAELAYGGRGVAAADDRKPVDLGQRLGDRAGARGEGVELEHAHRAVPEHRLRVGQRRGERLRRVGADVEAQLVVRDRVGGYDGRVARASADGNAERDHDVGRAAASSTPASAARCRYSVQVSTWSSSSRLLPTSWPCALRKVNTMPPPMSSLSALPSRLSMTPSLSDTLEPPSTHDVGPLRVLGQPAQHVDLLGDQAAHGVRQPLRDVVHARLLAVHDAEAVADEGVGQRGQLVGERTALGVVLAGLARVEPDVLEQRDLAVGERRRRSRWRTRRRCRRERHGGAEQLAEPVGDRTQRVLSGRVRPSAGPRCAVTTTRAPRVGELLDRRHAGPDPAVVGDPAAVERDVEVGADEDPLAPDSPPEWAAEVRRCPTRSEGLADVA